MSPQEALQEAEASLTQAKQNYDQENFYASFFLSKEALEKALHVLYFKKFRKEPKTSDPVYLLKDINPPQHIQALCHKVLEPIHPSRLHSPRTTGEILAAVKEILTFVKQQ